MPDGRDERHDAIGAGETSETHADRLSSGMAFRVDRRRAGRIAGDERTAGRCCRMHVHRIHSKTDA